MQLNGYPAHVIARIGSFWRKAAAWQRGAPAWSERKSFRLRHFRAGQAHDVNGEHAPARPWLPPVESSGECRGLRRGRW